MTDKTNSDIFAPSLTSIAFPQLLYVSKVDQDAWAITRRVAHQHDHLEIGFIRNGSGRFLVGNEEFTLSPGDIYIYNQGVFHDEQFEDTALGVYALGVDNVFLKYLPPNCLISENDSPIIHCQDCAPLISSICGYLYNALETSSYELDSSAHYALVTLISLLVDKSKTPRRVIEDKSPQHTLCSKAIDYIKEHYLEDINLNDISQAISMSPYYMSRTFKKCTGFSPMQYVTRLRLGKAQVMLIHTSMPIIDIAYSTGYNNLSTFNCAFSKSMGMTPDKFRKLYSHIISKK